MATLSAGDRTLGFNQFLRERNDALDRILETKPNVKAAFDALDDYFNTNQAAINTTIPLPARTTLTTQQKALLAIVVLQRRFLSGV